MSTLLTQPVAHSVTYLLHHLFLHFSGGFKIFDNTKTSYTHLFRITTVQIHKVSKCLKKRLQMSQMPHAFRIIVFSTGTWDWGTGTHEDIQYTLTKCYRIRKREEGIAQTPKAPSPLSKGIWRHCVQTSGGIGTGLGDGQRQSLASVAPVLRQRAFPAEEIWLLGMPSHPLCSFRAANGLFWKSTSEEWVPYIASSRASNSAESRHHHPCLQSQLIRRQSREDCLNSGMWE